MIHVVAIITAKPGQRDRILEVFRANRPVVLAEDGCVAYEATIDAANTLPSRSKLGDDVFVVIERWDTMAALDAHSASPHMAAYGAKVKDWLADRAVHVLEAI